MPDLLQILCAHCSGNQILVTWRYLFLRESNNAARCAGKCPNPQCLSAPRGATLGLHRIRNTPRTISGLLQELDRRNGADSSKNARDIMARRLSPEIRKAPAMRTPPKKPIWLESTLPWHHTARNKHRVQPSTYRRSPLLPELRGCTGAR